MTLDARATVYSADNAKVLAQAATMAYNAPQECKAWAIKQGFSPERFEFFDVNDTQGFVAENDQALIVAFRGTQPNRPVDWMSDAQAVHSPWSHTVGKVHKGFYDALNIGWKRDDQHTLPRRLLGHGDKTIWITGHSLGGALAELCAARASFDSAMGHVPIQGVYTFGQPRVGDDAFASLLNHALGSRIYRFVNDRDIVPRVPFYSMGYRHYGNQTFFDHAGVSSDAVSAVETLANALLFAERALSFEPLAQAAGLVGDFVKGVAHGMRLEDREQAAKARVNAILHSGIENVADHDMRKCYMERLKTTLT